MVMIAVLSGLVACGEKAADHAARPLVPFVFTAKEPAASLQFRFPDSAAGLAQIRDRLSQEARTLFTETTQGCEIARTDALREGLEFRPCSVAVVWRETAAAGTIVSYEGNFLLATGAAHPNLVRKGLLWDLATGEVADFTNLFTAPDSVSALKERLCEALRSAKATRLKGAGLDPTEAFECPDPTTLPMTLARAGTGDSFAGIFFLVDPYVIGSYAEGPYDAFLPVSAFRDFLAPVWQGRFGGIPAAGQLPGADGFPVSTPDFGGSAGES